MRAAALRSRWRCASSLRRASAAASEAALGCACWPPTHCWLAAWRDASRSAVEGRAATAACSAGPRSWKGCTCACACHAAITEPQSSLRRRPEGPRGSGAAAGT